MEFRVVGLNHRTAPLEIRERLAITRADLEEALKATSRYVNQGVILSTCNRSELYTLGPERHLKTSVEEFLTDYFPFSLEELDPFLYSYRQEHCAHHLFRVASGLDSMILGEGEILRQVRDAFGAAVEAHTVRGPLSRLFHHALRVGKRVRRDTGISRNALSVSRACVELARHLLGDLSRLRVMVIGAGDAGKLAVSALKDSGVEGVWVTNRTHERAVELARDLAGEAIPFQNLADVLEDVDIVIGSTDSPGYVLEAGAVRKAVARRPDRPLFLIDIAVPRDIDPASAKISNVSLYDVDDLQTVSEANRIEREGEARAAEEIVTEEVGQFLDWYRTLEVIPTISALRKRTEQIRERELAKLLRKLDHKLTSQELESLEAMTHAIVNKLMHHPTTYLKEQPSRDTLQLARELFSLDEEGSSVPED